LPVCKSAGEITGVYRVDTRRPASLASVSLVAN
jgi:hypothetical protein